jgi:cellulose synthase/poly-beta-1,6-N-acetylglucosamine synthase-like glycosyltransferase
MLIIEILHYLLLIYVGVSVLYLVAYTFFGLFPYKTKKPIKNKQNKFVVFIPAYKEDNIIFDTAKRALNQNYPTNLFDIIVIADSFQQKTIDDLKTLPITVKEVSFKNSNKAKALNKTMSGLPDNQYDCVIILDADNILEPNFIKKINDSFNTGYHVIQGHRTAKNKEGFAMLDAISEEINNHIYSKGHRAIGLSSRLVGSAMAISYSLYKDTMKNIDSYRSEDKELELILLKQGYEFEYRHDAICYDEKVSSVNVLNNQRTRWIFGQYYFLKKDFFNAFWKLITERNINYFNKAFQMILPPRLILLGFLFISSVVSFFLSPHVYFYVWTGIFIAYILSCFISIPRKFYSLQLLYSFIYLPKAFLGIIISLLTTKGSNKKFIHTPHTNIKSNIEY